MHYTNNDILSLLAGKLTKQLGKYGTNKAISIPLWSDPAVPTNFWDKVNHLFGRFHRTNNTSLTVRFSTDTGYSLQGASWEQINTRLEMGITTLANKIAKAVRNDWERNHGWERSLEEVMVELDDLQLELS